MSMIYHTKLLKFFLINFIHLLNLYNVEGLLTHDLQTLAEELYRPGDDAHTLATRMLNYIEMSNYLDGGYSAANGGITSGGENSSSGGTVKMTSKTKYKLVPFYETQWIYWINYTQGTYSEDWLQALVYIGNGFIKYKVYEFEFIYYYNYGSSEAEQNQSCLIKIFGPKAKPTDSWIWRAFRGTGKRKKDMFNATMLGLVSAVATVAAGEITIAYGDAIVAASAKAYEAISAKVFTASQSIHAFVESQMTFLQTYISNIFEGSKFFYYRNAYAINDASLSFIANIFPGGQYQRMTPYGQIIEWRYNKWYQEMIKILR
ncbi:hypothetical protein ACX8XN_08560 [Calditrichota bacterium GD2]